MNILHQNCNKINIFYRSSFCVNLSEHVRINSPECYSFLPMMAYSKERDKHFDFSVPHTIAYDAFFTKKGSPKVSSLNDLEQKKIIVMKNDQAHDYLRSLEYISDDKLVLIDNLEDGLRMLASGEGDAALMPKLVGLILIKNLNLTNLEQSPVVIEAYKRPFGFTNENS